MSLAITLGIASALFYGTTDFVSHFANKTSGVLRTMLYSQLFLACILSGWLFFTTRIPITSPATWSVLIASDFTILLFVFIAHWLSAIFRLFLPWLLVMVRSQP